MIQRNKVLLIDDEAPLLLGLSVIMKREGYEVFTAKNGSEGLELAKSKKPDVIISDVMMPSPNGFELRDLLNQDDEMAGIPFIFLTAKIEQADKIRGIVGGADDYITKPFDRNELVARVEAILRRKAIERSNGIKEAQTNAEEEMDRFKQEIVQNVRHELRTPLVNVMLPLELAISNKFDEPIEQVNFIKAALANAEKMQSLVEDFIIMSEIDQGGLNTINQEIHFESNIEPAIQKRLAYYKDKQLKLDLIKSFSGRLYGPRNEIKRAILHLMDNAFKFSPEGGTIRLEIVSLKPDELAVIVTDHGPGIPLEMRERVFEKFFQISQGSDRKYQGLGLGLTIAREIARALGGDVNILERTTGTAVILRLPLGKAAE